MNIMPMQYKSIFDILKKNIARTNSRMRMQGVQWG